MNWRVWDHNANSCILNFACTNRSESMALLKPIFSLILVFSTILQIYAINPDREYIRTPKDLGLDYESNTVKTIDGYDIITWTYLANPEKENDKLLILAYPDAGNMSYFVYQSAIFANHGYTVVTFDYRGFGKSSDFAIEKDLLYHPEFSIDLIAVTDFIHKKFQDKKIGIWALSMGSIIAVKSIPSLQDKVAFLISEGFVTDTSVVVERIKAQRNRDIQLPESKYSFQNSLSKITIPILLFAAENDQLTPYEDALAFQKSTKSCNIICFQGDRLSGFNSGEGEWGDFYIATINAFLDTF